jgi:hypothetical protein
MSGAAKAAPLLLFVGAGFQPALDKTKNSLLNWDLSFIP